MIVEVRANLSFSGPTGSFEAGRHYQLDVTMPQNQALLDGGYFSLIQEDDDDRVDTVEPGHIFGFGLVAGVSGREETEE